ncbi:ABC transporter ATP-binding protein [Paenibacillus ihumii]|uniref:ABC transporter ATP-binding protein n=1 Tax=Paenibacillus ihumii TaxID=687436 RepID=UPI0006D81188|nr:ABC transporter ATP-binding protein [Paenibacillus ihumii]
MIIDINNMSKSYGENLVLDQICLKVKRGSIFGILGRNGAGKTSLIETMIGIRKKDSGKVTILDQNIESVNDTIKYHVGLQPQTSALLPRQTILETLTLFASLYPNPLPVKQVMSQLGLDQISNKRINHLSGGQKQRVLLAVTMIGDPKLLILDEPTAGLDPQVRRSLWSIIRDLRDQGRTILLTTHYMEEAEQLCDEVAILHDKHIIMQNSPEQIINVQQTKTLEDAFVSLTGNLVEAGWD